MKSFRRALAVLTPVVLAAACVPTWMTSAVLTGAGDYDVSGTAEALTITAPTGSADLRMALFAASTPASVDQSTCATWVDGLDTNAQQGLMLRWDGTHGVSVTKNVVYGIYSTINVHTWDVSIPDPEKRYAQVAQFGWMSGLQGPTGGWAAGPWQACAEVKGATLTFAVWPTSRPKPAPGDPCCTGTATVPVTAGRPGWYAGHLPAGATIHMTGLVAGAL